MRHTGVDPSVTSEACSGVTFCPLRRRLLLLEKAVGERGAAGSGEGEAGGAETGRADQDGGKAGGAEAGRVEANRYEVVEGELDGEELGEEASG